MRSKSISDFSGTVFDRDRDSDCNFKVAFRILIIKQAPFYSYAVMCTRENGNEAGESPG